MKICFIDGQIRAFLKGSGGGMATGVQHPALNKAKLSQPIGYVDIDREQHGD